MDESRLSLPKQDIRKLLGAASGDAALLYLYLRAGFDPIGSRGRAANAVPAAGLRHGVPPADGTDGGKTLSSCVR